MRSRFFATALTLTMVFMVEVTTKGQTQPAAAATLSNSSVVKLVRAGFSEKALIAIIRSRPTRFDLSPEKLIELKKNRVTEKVILAMIAREQAVEVASENWEDDDDSFFNGPSGLKMPGDGASGKSNNSRAAGPEEMDIFGSSGGTRGRTKSRDGGGGVDNDTQTVGSASVRILRPPAEAGGVAGEARLEKTPTLRNDSVVELVEAGFSEGTIIRRIEHSPVEFDLSADKLAELRKRRVTEPVIAAMQAAMSDEK